MGDVVKIALTFDWGIHLLEINNGPFLGLLDSKMPKFESL
jgi:hypothetical protein